MLKIVAAVSIAAQKIPLKRLARIVAHTIVPTNVRKLPPPRGKSELYKSHEIPFEFVIKFELPLNALIWNTLDEKSYSMLHNL